MSNKRKPNISREAFEHLIQAGDRMASCIYNLLQGSHKLTDAHTAEAVGEWQRKWDAASRRALTEDNQ